MLGTAKLKQTLLKAEKGLRPKLDFLKWMNKETPLMLLLLLWACCLVVCLAFLVPVLMGWMGSDDYNIVLSILALVTTMILSIVVVL